MKILLFLIFFISNLAFAESTIDYKKMHGNCWDDAQKKSNGRMTTGNLAACAEGTSVEAKKEMNTLYKRLYKNLSESSPEDALKLEQSQKAWLIYRDKYCELAGSQIGSPMYAVCPMDLNIQRVNELREFFN